MKLILTLLIAFTLLSCNGDDSKSKKADAQSLRNRNLALAYIDRGMMQEASEKLALLEQALPEEAFVYANQGLVALRQNQLVLANALFQTAAKFAPSNSSIALLRAETAMLNGEFEQSTQILEDSIRANPKNIQLRWARKDNVEHLLVIVKTLPKNITARLALIKELLKVEKFNEARNHLLLLQEQGVVQDEQAMGLFNGALIQIDNEKARVARAQVIGLDNVLKPTRAWQHSLLEVAGPPGTVGHPLRNFVNTSVPDWVQPKARTVSFTKDVASVMPAGKKRVLLIESPTQSELVTIKEGYANFAVPIDWNNDRKLDVVVGTLKGKVFVEGGSVLLEENGTPISALTPWDADQDGDLDLLVSRDTTFLLQNNGDGTTSIVELDTPVLRATHIIDVDEDGAVDVIGISPKLTFVVLKNERSGKIHAIDSYVDGAHAYDLTVGDFNNDGWMDVAYLALSGKAVIAENNHDGSFSTKEIGGFGINIHSADLDNDTRRDIIVGGEAFEIFLANGNRATIPAIGNLQIIDADLDGDLDIVTTGTQYAVWLQDGSPSENDFQKVILEAILEGGQRNNSLAVGGFVEVSAGGTYQKHLITGPMTHIGLGGKPSDSVRVVWPNGVPQEVIEPEPNQVFTEVQILKGSCPFLATTNDDGSWEFVTDLLWRSPLGLKINAQTVPPIAATQDWVKVRGDQLTPRNGVYELAITAQLWETHFIDEVKMIAVDHPIGTEIFVDERFVAPVPPAYQLYAYEKVQVPVSAFDQNGRDVLDVVRERDGKRLGGFAKGPYQGVAADHYVEIYFGKLDSTLGVDLIAQGWIRPTDTSINVASSQGSAPLPKALEISVPNGKGGWNVVIANGGFPAGKLKTIILEIPAGSFAEGDYRVRISTNLEIYWDRISYAEKSNSKTINIPIELQSADLGYMGFPLMSRTDDDAPNIPDYNEIRHGNVWRDLEGFYTRYGAVEELLLDVDDRYAIMNAGDAMYLQFEEPKQQVADGYTRDYIFFCDGWVKDGDWNTVESRTVGPLPFHTMSGYPYPEDERPDALLPSHSDWVEYHTRYITPAPFRDVLK
jgi:hypothetical protein